MNETGSQAEFGVFTF